MLAGWLVNENHTKALKAQPRADQLINPLKPSGAKWLHLRASRATLV